MSAAAEIRTVPQTTWKLLAPDWSALDTVWKNPLPFVLWPVGHQPLIAHWMDEAVRRGVETVELFVADRPAEVRAWLEGGAYWSRRLRVVPIAREADAPVDAECLTGLPGEESDTAPGDGRALLQHWFALQKRWLAQRDDAAVTLDTQHASGGWIGPQASIHPSAKLIAPFWIGAQAKIGASCEIGPDALIGSDAVLDENVTVRAACVLGRTYLGRHTELVNAAAAAGTLLDFTRGCRVEIGERFILSPVAGKSRGASATQRLGAAVLFALLAPLARLWCRAWEVREVASSDGAPLRLRTGKSGPLWVRRWPWLAEIARGHLRWVGILPRAEAAWSLMPAELATPLRTAEPGLLSLADVHGCHDPADPEEWIHAVYQAQRADPRVTATVLRNFWKIAWFKNANISS